VCGKQIEMAQENRFLLFFFIAESRFSCCAMTSLILVAKINLVVFASTASTMTKDTGLGTVWVAGRKKKKNGSGDMKPSHVSTIYNSSSITLERQKAGPAIQLEDVIIPQTLHDLPDAIEYHRLVVRFLLSHHELHLADMFTLYVSCWQGGHVVLETGASVVRFSFIQNLPVDVHLKDL
jgi:hypothetical protein